VLGLLYDVHGNLAALEAVLEDARRVGVDEWMLGGDYAMFGAWPLSTVERLRDLENATWIRGNVDRWSGDPADAPDDEIVQSAIADCRDALGDSLADELGALPFEHERDDTRFVHASPVSDVRSFTPEPGDDEAELLEGVTRRRLVFGHTHLQFRRAADRGIELINPGSVGVPLDGDTRAAYAVVQPDGRITARRVPYDSSATVKQLQKAFGGRPWVDEIARRVAEAKL
jgi:predicted phosphodiesterase